VGCSAARTPGARAKAPATLIEAPASAYVSPARWDFHPPAPLTPLGAFQLPDGGCVFTAEGGQRWTAATTRTVGSRIVCSGAAQASLSVAPEELTAVARRGSGSWLFVGEGGTLYESNEPLGAFARTVPAPEPFAKVTGAGQSVLAATQDGRLMRWDPAKGWAAAAPSPALANAHVFDLVTAPSAPDGKQHKSTPRVLALAFPEALFQSEDEGATWRAVQAPTIGARRLGGTGAGDLGAQGIAESIVWRDSGKFVRVSERLLVPAASLAVEVGRAPSVTSVFQGHAALDGDRYYEVVHPENDGEPWLFAHGHLEGRLETSTLPDSGRCGNIRLAARGNVVVIACTPADGDPAAELRRSTDGGASFSEPLRLASPAQDQTGLAVAADGRALVTGLCAGATESGAACKPSTPLLLGAGPDAGTALRVVPTAAPQLSGVAQSAVFSIDGRSAYFLGKRGKDDRIGIFVSHDAGATFSPRALQAAVVTRPSRRPDDDDGAQEPEGPETLEIDENTTLSPADDGTVGLAARSHSSNVYVTTDEDGRVRAVASPPLDDEGSPAEVFFAGYGQRVLALPSYLGGDGTTGAFWESLDGGANWDRQAMPMALVREYSKNNMAGVCSAAGCLLGDTLARVGWGGNPDTSSAAPPADPSPDAERRILTPITCELSANAKWAAVDDVVVPENAGSPLPTVRELMRGHAVWSTLVHDRATGAVAVVSATLPDRPDAATRVTKKVLLGARGKNTVAAIVTNQADGYAALRAPYPADAQGKLTKRAPLRDVEVAWEDLVAGTSGHARIAELGTLEPGDVGADGALHPPLVAIRPRHLIIRMHGSRATTSAEEAAVDTGGRVERYTSAAFPAQGALGALDVRPDATFVGGEIIDVGFVAEDGRVATTLLAAKRSPSGTWAWSAESALPSRAGSTLSTFTAWSSTSTSTGLMALVSEPSQGRAWAHVLGLRADGGFAPPEPAATLYDLGARPRPCTPAERASTARLAMPLKANGTLLFPGARHPVLVFEPHTKGTAAVGEPVVLLTSGAVLHGTPASPCLAAFQADGALRAPVAAAIQGDLAHAWLFRATVDAPTSSATGRYTLEYRPMSCRYEPAAPIPEFVWTQEGVLHP
jgi:hypothetical protein